MKLTGIFAFLVVLAVALAAVKHEAQSPVSPQETGGSGSCIVVEQVSAPETLVQPSPYTSRGAADHEGFAVVDVSHIDVVAGCPDPLPQFDE